MARDAWEDGLTKPEAPPVRFVKVHDAHTINSAGKPVLGGSAGAHGAIVIVRDPRDVAPSLAHQYDLSIDEAIAFMHDEDRALSNTKSAQDSQFRQKLRGWSGHVTSWLDQKDIPIHLIRYEELRQDTPGTLSRALAFAGVSVAVETINRAVAAGDFEVLRELEQQKGFVEAPRRGTTFFRRGEVGAWRDELTRDQVMKLEARHWQTMLRLGYRLSHSNLARAG